MEAVPRQWRAALPVHGVHVALPHAPRDGAAHHVEVTSVFTSGGDLVAEAVLAADADSVVLVAVKRHGQGVSPCVLFADQINVNVLTDFLSPQEEKDSETEADN